MNLVDLNGKTIKSFIDNQQMVGHYYRTFQTANIANGIYLLAVRIGDQRNSVKIIKH